MRFCISQVASQTKLTDLQLLDPVCSFGNEVALLRKLRVNCLLLLPSGL